jgi:hypothetical protein
VPAELNVSVRETTATERSSYSARLMLVGPPPPPAEVLPALPGVARQARLRGRRLTMTVVCPTECAGRVAVRANGRTLARKSFAGIGRRTLRMTLRRRSTQLRAVLIVPGHPPVTTRLSVR